MDPVSDLRLSDPTPSSAVSEAIRKECTTGLCAKRGLGTGSRFGLSVLVLAGVVLALAASRRGGFDNPAVAAAMSGALVWGVIQIGILAVGLVRPLGKRASVAQRVALGAALPVAFFAYLAFFGSRWEPAGDFFGTNQSLHAVGCGMTSSIAGALGALGVLFAWKGTDPFTPGLSGALVGLTGGLAGAAGIGIVCPAAERWHLFVGHGVGIMAVVALGWYVGRRVLAP